MQLIVVWIGPAECFSVSTVPYTLQIQFSNRAANHRDVQSLE